MSCQYSQMWLREQVNGNPNLIPQIWGLCTRDRLILATQFIMIESGEPSYMPKLFKEDKASKQPYELC